MSSLEHRSVKQIAIFSRGDTIPVNGGASRGEVLAAPSCLLH